MTNPKSTSWLRPRFTLAALLLFVTLCAPFFAYIASVRKWNQHRKQAYDALLAKDVQFRPRGRPSPNATPERTALQKIWFSLVADANLPVFALVTLRESSAGAITNDDLKSLEYFPEIEEFHFLGSAAVTDEGLAILAKLPKLKIVQLFSLPNVNGEFLTDFRDNSGLEDIRFSSCEKLRGQNLRPLRRLNRLTSLSVSQAPLLDDDALRGVDLPPSISHLGVHYVKIGDETLARWLSQVSLQNLGLEAPITRAVAPALAKQTNLELLMIRNSPLIDNDFLFLKDSPQLSRLGLIGMPIRGEILDYIANPEQVTILEFSNSLFSDEHLAKISRFSNLEAINLAWTPLTGEGFSANVEWPQLAHLQLSGTRFTDQGKEALSKFRGLKYVTLPSNWSPADMARFSNENMPKNPMLNAYLARPAPNTVVRNDLYSATMQQEKIDNCPADLMKPVMDLHALGIAERQESRRRRQDGGP